MPSFTVCTSCGKRCRRRPDTAAEGPLCFACRERLCLTCRRPLGSGVHSGVRFCSEECRQAYRAEVAAPCA